MPKIKRDKEQLELAEAIIEKYKPETVSDIQNAIKDMFGPIFESMLQGEMTNHLGYKKSDSSSKFTTNRRNGYINKTLKTSTGKVKIDVPRDRESTFEPRLIPKRETNVSEIENKVLSMYAKGMSQRDISEIIEDIYGFDISHETISDITDSVVNDLEEWQNRPLKRLYTFVFIDCMFVTIRKEYETKQYAVYTMLGYDIDGSKDILGLWFNESESKHVWMQIFDEIKSRGVEDILFVSMDGVSGLEAGAKSVFKDTIVQRCIVHLIRNSLKYIPSKEYKRFTSHLKKIYSAPSAKAARLEFEKFKQVWSTYSGAIDVWERNFAYVEQLFDYGSAVRKVMYTTNAIESVHSSFRKVTRKGAFPGENALLKVLYLRIRELYKKWSNRSVSNWAMVRNQLVINDRFKERIRKYE